MTDIISLDDGLDLGVADTQAPRAQNILSVQIATLEYAQSVGIDLKFFLSEQFKFQLETFKAYLIQVLASYGINVSGVAQLVNSLFTELDIELESDATNSGLVG